MCRLSRILIGLAVLATAAVAPAAFSQGFPAKPVRLIVPNSPGGGTDIMARLLAQRLQELWGQPIVVDYRPGAGTVTGTEYVVKAAPDGYTLGLALSSLVINPSVRSNLPYDTLKDLAPVSITAVAPNVITATPSLEANTMAQLIALAKKNPGKLSFATAGTGSGLHMAAELLKMTAGIDMIHVPYKGTGPAYPDVMAGRVQLLFDPLFSSLPYIKTGKLKPLAVTSPERSPSAPDIAALAETLPGFNVVSTNGIIAPGATPKELVARISADLATAVRNPEMRTRMAEIGLEPVGSTPEQYQQFIRSEIEKWAKVVKFSGVKLD